MAMWIALFSIIWTASSPLLAVKLRIPKGSNNLGSCNIGESFRQEPQVNSRFSRFIGELSKFGFERVYGKMKYIGANCVPFYAYPMAVNAQWNCPTPAVLAVLTLWSDPK
jgi:hypothetical protein